jgi:carboxypeptidase C (cathepsin A)
MDSTRPLAILPRRAWLSSLLLVVLASVYGLLLAQPAPAEGASAAAEAPAESAAATPPHGPPAPAPAVVTRFADERLDIEDLPAPKRFVTQHKTTIRGKALSYTATAGETYITNLFGEPTASIFTFAYVKDGPRDPERPVMFVFNGGPGSSSVWLHLGVIGPRRLVLDQEVNPSNTPPFGLSDSTFSPLDVTDLVFIDPVGTGFSHAVGNAKNADFFGVDEDADAVARFIELWLTENQRWTSPKYLMGESYGATRAAILPRALMGGPLYSGVMRGITVNGVILVSPALGIGVPAAAAPEGPDPRVGQAIPGMAVTAWYHGRTEQDGRSAAQVYQEALQFATTDYANAVYQLGKSILPDAELSRIAAQLETLISLPQAAWIENKLDISSHAFLKQVLAAQGLEAGNYDSRYTLPLAGSGGDPVADDPAMGRYVPGFVAAFHEMMTTELAVDMPVPYNSITFAEVNYGWKWERIPIARGRHPAEDLAMAVRRTPALRVMVATGYYDMGTSPASALNQMQAAEFPEGRLYHRHYESGHMLYLGDTEEAFADDVRDLILGQQ